MAFLKAAINSLDPTPDKKTEITLLLSLLSELCEQKVSDFTNNVEQELRTAGDAENRTIPVREIIARHKEYRAYVRQDAGKIATEVASAVKKFVSGGSSDIIEGVASLTTSALEAIIGAGTGTQQEMGTYYIVVQDYAIVRYDVRAWSRQIEAKGITSQIETALAIVAFKSSVDVHKISFNTFLIAYGSQLAAMNFSPAQQKEYLTYAKEVFDQLRSEDGVRATGNHIAINWEQPGNPIGVGAARRFRAPGEFVGSLWK